MTDRGLFAGSGRCLERTNKAGVKMQRRGSTYVAFHRRSRIHEGMGSDEGLAWDLHYRLEQTATIWS